MAGLRTFLRVTITLVVGVLVGYNSAIPVVGNNFYLIQLLVFLGGSAIGFVELSKPPPLPLTPSSQVESHSEDPPMPD